MGVTADFAEGLHWYRIAADQGNAEAHTRWVVRIGMGGGGN